VYDVGILNTIVRRAGHSSVQVAVGAERHCTTDHWHVTSWSHHAGTMRANSTGYPTEIVSSSKSHVWFASRCPCRRLSTWQMIAASCPTALCGQLRDSDLRGAANTQQLGWQNFCGRWTSLVELSSGPAAQFRHHLRTVQTASKNEALC